MIYVYYVFAAALLYLSYRSYSGGIRYLRFVRERLATAATPPDGLASVIVPCKGLDEGLTANLEALLHQDHPAYEVIFVVDDAGDPAVPVIESLTAQSSLQTKLVVAPRTQHSSQKVENLRVAVTHVDDRAKYLVFADSDMRAGRYWLGSLTAALDEENIGAATGYRWFISDRPTIGSELSSAWNASIATALGPDTAGNFCWGGSMAVRRDTFEKLDIREHWLGTLSDDFVVTRTVREAGLEIAFVPQALVASIERATIARTIGFTTRQMKITRVYAPRLWLMSLFGSLLFNFIIAASILLAVLADERVTQAAAIFTLVGVTALSLAKSLIRLRAVRLMLPAYDAELRRQLVPQLVLTMLTPALFTYNSLAALISRRMTWRGIRYELKSPTETVIISD